MKQPLGNFDQGLALQSNNNDHQLNHWSSQQQPSTSQQPDHRENNGYSINKITSQSEGMYRVTKKNSILITIFVLECN